MIKKNIKKISILVLIALLVLIGVNNRKEVIEDQKVGSGGNKAPSSLLQTNSDGTLNTNLATSIAGEDIANDVLKVEQRFAYATTTGDLLIKTGVGFLHSITCAQTDAAPTAGGIIVYDNTAESGSIMFNWSGITTTVFMPFTVILDQAFSTGLYVGYTTTADVNCTFSYR